MKGWGRAERERKRKAEFTKGLVKSPGTVAGQEHRSLKQARDETEENAMVDMKENEN